MSPRPDKKPSPAAPPAEAAAAPQAAREACFVRENGSAAICSFKTAEGATWMLPLGQLSAAEGDADGRTLRLIFSGAEVRLAGAHLERIGEAIARGHAFRVCAVNPSFKSEYEPEVFVSLIEVTAAKPSLDEAADFPPR
jgi:hypothetical protein